MFPKYVRWATVGGTRFLWKLPCVCQSHELLSFGAGEQIGNWPAQPKRRPNGMYIHLALAGLPLVCTSRTVIIPVSPQGPEMYPGPLPEVGALKLVCLFVCGASNCDLKLTSFIIHLTLNAFYVSRQPLIIILMLNIYEQLQCAI